MTEAEFQELLVGPDCTLRDALDRLNRTGRGILLVLREDGRLRRTLTDGDLRRAMLDHVSGSATIAMLPERPPITLSESDGMAAATAALDRHQIDHVPVIDAQDRPVDLVTRRELSQRIWLSSPHLGEDETAFVEEAFRTNWIAPLGPHVDGFERELAAHVGIADAAAVSSGTAAIHLALLLLGVRPGDTVFCSSLTFVGSCNPIVYCNARPVFIDSDAGTWNMSPAALERAFEWAHREGRMPRCVIVVNLYGQSADMDALLPICRKWGVPVLEDAAESLGALYKGRASGTFGDIGVYSFNGNKIITTSGGGMLVSADPAHMARARKLATQSREPAAHYEHVEVGFNYRMSNVLAGIGRGQLRVLDERVSRRRAIFEQYRDALSTWPQLEWMPQPEGFHSTRWLTCFTLAAPAGAAERDALLRALERHSIEARPVWKPMHMQPLFRDAPFFPHAEGADIARGLFERGVCLPSGSNMTDVQTERVIDQLGRTLTAAEGRLAADSQ